MGDGRPDVSWGGYLPSLGRTKGKGRTWIFNVPQESERSRCSQEEKGRLRGSEKKRGRKASVFVAFPKRGKTRPCWQRKQEGIAKEEEHGVDHGEDGKGGLTCLVYLSKKGGEI